MCINHFPLPLTFLPPPLSLLPLFSPPTSLFILSPSLPRSFYLLPPSLLPPPPLFPSLAPSLPLSLRAVRLQFLLQFYQFQHIHHINSNGIFENIKQMAMLKTNDFIKSNIYTIKTEIDLQTFKNNFDTEHQNEWQCTSQWNHHLNGSPLSRLFIIEILSLMVSVITWYFGK